MDDSTEPKTWERSRRTVAQRQVMVNPRADSNLK